MKRALAFCRIAVVAFPFFILSTFAQSSSGTNYLFSGDDLLRVVLTNAFDASKSFSGLAKIKMENPEMPIDVDLGVCAQNGDIRFYLDKTKVQGDPIFVEAAKMNLQEGLAHVVTLFKKGDSARYTIFPDRKMFKHTNEGLSLLPAVDFGEPFEIKPADGGTETIDGHACRKIEVRVVTKKDSKVAAVIWQAKDLDNAPIKAVLDIAQDVKIQVVNIQTNKLDAKLFEVPPGFREFTGSYYMPQFVTPTNAMKK